jgi:hypothetical protein
VPGKARRRVVLGTMARRCNAARRPLGLLEGRGTASKVFVGHNTTLARGSLQFIAVSYNLVSVLIGDSAYVDQVLCLLTRAKSRCIQLHGNSPPISSATLHAMPAAALVSRRDKSHAKL